MRKSILLITIAVFFFANAAQTQPPDSLWSQTYGGNQAEWIRSMVQTPEGGFVLSGETYTWGPGRNDYWLVKTDAVGDVERTRIYGTPARDGSLELILTTEEDGGYGFAGVGRTWSFGDVNDSDWWLFKFDESLDSTWSRIFSTDLHEGADGMNSPLIQLANRGFALGGQRQVQYEQGISYDAVLILTDENGERPQELPYGTGDGLDAFSHFIETNEGILCMGYTESWDAEGIDPWLRMIDPEEEEEGWEQIIQIDGDQLTVKGVKTSDGGYALVGAIIYNRAFRDAQNDGLLVKTDENGEMLWVKRYGGDQCDILHGIIELHNGALVLLGRTDSFGARGGDGWMLLTDDKGDSLWSVNLGGNDFDQLDDILELEDHSLAIGGNTMVQGRRGEIWFLRYGPPEFGFVEGHVVDAETEEPLPDVTVTTPYDRYTTTDEEGFYSLTYIWADNTVLTASIEGYNDLIIEDLELAVDETLEVSFEMLHPELSLNVDEFNTELNQNESAEEFFDIRNEGNGFMEWWVERRLQGEAGAEPFELRRSHMVGGAVEDNSIQGAVLIEDRYYVSGRHGGNPQIYIFDRDGEFVGSFDQPGDDDRGFKDLAWDGNLIWGIASNITYGFDLEGNLNTSFNSPVRSSSSIAWDIDRELLWICSISSDLTAVDLEGNVVAELDDHGLRIYGLAYWSGDPDGYPLYSFSKESDTNRPFLHKFNPDEDEFVFVAYLDTELGGSPYGVFIAEHYDAFSSALIAIANTSANAGGDRIDVWQLQPNVDWMVIDPVEGELDPDAETEISLTLDATDLEPVLWEGELAFDHAVAVEETRVPITLNVLGDDDQLRELPVSLDVNWNMISINVTPPEEMWEREEGPDVILMTEQLRIDENNHHLLLMKDEDGMFYLPAFRFNNIPYWNLTEGYLIKVDEDIEAVWSGEPIPADADIPLEQDWNLVAYYPTYELDATAPDNYVLSPIIDDVLIAKDGDGNFMLPAFNFSNMPPWRETQGYQVRVDEAMVLNYPPEREDVRAVRCPHLTENNPPYPPLLRRGGNTDENMSVLVTSISGVETKIGDKIGAFSCDGRLVGFGTIDYDVRCGLAVWGDDTQTEEIDGLLAGETFELQILDTRTKLSIESIESGSGLVYKTDEFTVLDVGVESTIPTEFYLSQPYPNPFNSTTKITYGLPEASEVSLKLYDLSGRLIQTLVDGEKQAGIQTAILNAAELPSGLYFIRLCASGHVFTRKVMLVR